MAKNGNRSAIFHHHPSPGRPNWRKLESRILEEYEILQ